MSEKIKISETDEGFKDILASWKKDARDMSLEALPGFLSHLMDDYEHDYETVVYAVSIASQAAAWAINKHPQGGITGFQASFVMWDFIRSWQFESNKTGLRIVDFDKMLYPQYSDSFQKTISSDTWDSLQKAASEEMSEADANHFEYLKNMEQYEKDIAAFIDKYPDYHARREHYDRLGMGTSEQWDAEREKEESGFEFAPGKPFEPVSNKDRVYRHWESIVSGVVPFGYRVADND